MRRHGWHHRARSALRRSLRLRLVLVFWVLALCMTVIFLVGTQRALSVGWRLAAAPLLADYVDRIVMEIGSPPSVERARALTVRLPLSVRIEGPVIQWASHPEHHHESGDGDFDNWRKERPPLLERTTSDGHRVVLGLGDLPWKSQPRLVGWVTLGMLLLLTAAAYAYVRHLLRPLDDIRLGAERYGRGEFDSVITVRRNDELGDLATQINTMAHDLHGMLEGKRALLLAISHELRSPLTRARLHVELLPDNSDTQSARDALLVDLAQMRDLISDLLEGERLAGSHAALHLEQVDLGALVRDVVSSNARLAGIQLDCQIDLPRQAMDATRMRLVVRNLLDNAARHGSSGAQPVRVSLHSGKAGLRLVVRDFGPGVDDALINNLGQPFYRTDSARQRSTGGVGLGLYLCRLVVQAHDGNMQVRNAHPGLEVCVELPPRTT